MALQLNGEPKTENWYVYHANKKAGLFLGLKTKRVKLLLEKQLKNRMLKAYVTG